MLCRHFLRSSSSPLRKRSFTIPIMRNITAINIKKFFIAHAIFTNEFCTLSLHNVGVTKKSVIQPFPAKVARSPLTLLSTVTVDVSRKFASQSTAAKRKFGSSKIQMEMSIRSIEV